MAQEKKSKNKEKQSVDVTIGMTCKEKVDFWFNDLTTPIGKAVDFTIIFLILFLCFLYVVATYPLPSELERIIHIVEFVIIGIFIIEYGLRMWVANNKLKHFFNIYSIIDLLSVLPFFLTFTNLQFLRIFRVFRVFRILRLIRFLKDEQFFFGKVKEDNLIIVRIIFTIFSIIFVSSGLVYYEEHIDNPKVNTFFDAAYFTIVTLTTVGFGDITPVTQGGKIITILMIISGVIFLPWQVGSLVKKFVMTIEKSSVICKSCGLKYHDKDAVHCKACGHKIYQEHEAEI